MYNYNLDLLNQNNNGFQLWKTNLSSYANLNRHVLRLDLKELIDLILKVYGF